MATNAGSVYVTLGGKLDRSEFRAYDRELDKVRAKTAKREEFKAKLGADYDSRAFNAYYRDLEKAERQSHKTTRGLLAIDGAFTRLSRNANGLRGPMGNSVNAVLGLAGASERAAKSITGAGGAGAGLIGGLAGLAGGAGAAAISLGAIGSVLISLSGAAVALAASLAAAAAGIGAVGVAALAAAGPLAAVAVAVVSRVGKISEAYKALSDQQQKGGDQAKGIAQAQEAAAERIKSAEQGVTDARRNGAESVKNSERQLADSQRGVQVAQDGLTLARGRARRELEDLANAADHAKLSEEGAGLALKRALENLTRLRTEAGSSPLDIQDAEHAVREAEQGVEDARVARKRATEDAKKGTDTLTVARKDLADANKAAAKSAEDLARAHADADRQVARAQDQVREARRSAQQATEKETASATTAQQKLAELTKTERELLATLRRTAAALKGIFQPATDAIFGSVSGALGRLTPLMASFKDNFTGIGDEVAKVITRASRSLAGSEWSSALHAFADTAERVIQPFTNAIGSFFEVLRNIAVASLPFLREFARYMERGFGNFAKSTGDADKMSGIIGTLVEHTKSWWHLLVDVTKLIVALFRGGADDGKGLVDSLDEVIVRWTDFLNSREGRKELKQFFRDAVEEAKALLKMFGKLVEILFDLSRAFMHIITNLEGPIDWIKDHTGVVKGFAAAWLAVKGAMIATAGASKAAGLAALVPGVGRGAAAGGAARGAGALAGARGVGAAGAAGLGAGAVGLLPTAVIAGGAFTLSNVIDGLDDKAENARAGLKKVEDAAKRLAAQGDSAGLRKLAGSLTVIDGDVPKREIDKVRGALNGYATDIEQKRNLTDAVTKDMAKQFRRMFRETDGSMDDIRKTVRINLKGIRINLGTESAEGKEALAKNYDLAVKAVRKSMRDAGKVTKEGLALIRTYLTKEMRVLGLGDYQIKDYFRDSGHGSGNEAAGGGHARGGWVKRAGGGWIGARGMVGRDDVPLAPGVLAARGEFDAQGPDGRRAIFNRHQAPIVEYFLGGRLDQLPSGRQLPAIEQALGGPDALDALFATVNRPHYLANGGRYARGGIAGAVAAANRFEKAAFPYVWGGGHEKSPTPFEPVDCSGAVSYVLQHAGVNIPTMVSGDLAKHGKPGPGALTVFANPEHTFMRIGNRYFGTSIHNPHGGAGWMPDPGADYKSRFTVRHYGPGEGIFDELKAIKAPNVRGGGAVGDIVQRTLQVAARGATRAARRAANSIGLGRGDSNNPPIKGALNKSQLARLWVKAGGPPGLASTMARIAIAESGGIPTRNNADRPGDGGHHIAAGLWQILGLPFPGNVYDPLTNARMAVAKWRSQGLGAWEVYTKGTYAKGGRIGQALAKGGRYLKLPKGWGWDYVDGKAYDIYNPTSDFGPAVNRAVSRLDIAAARAAVDTPDNFQDDLAIARWAERLYGQIYFSRVAHHAPGSKIKAAADQLANARSNVATIFGNIAQQNEARNQAADPSDPAGDNPDLQALLDQANLKAAGLQANLTAAGNVQRAFSSSGDIGHGGFGNAYQAAAGIRPIVNVYTLHPGDPQTLAAIGDAATAGQSMQSYIPATRTTIGV